MLDELLLMTLMRLKILRSNIMHMKNNIMMLNLMKKLIWSNGIVKQIKCDKSNNYYLIFKVNVAVDGIVHFVSNK